MMSTEQDSDSAPEQHSDSGQDSQLRNINVEINKETVEVNQFAHRFDYALFYNDFCKFLSCGGQAGKRGIGRAGLIKVEIQAKSTMNSYLQITQQRFNADTYWKNKLVCPQI